MPMPRLCRFLLLGGSAAGQGVLSSAYGGRGSEAFEDARSLSVSFSVPGRVCSGGPVSARLLESRSACGRGRVEAGDSWPSGAMKGFRLPRFAGSSRRYGGLWGVSQNRHSVAVITLTDALRHGRDV